MASLHQNHYIKYALNLKKFHENNTSASLALQSWSGSGKEGTEREHPEGHRFHEEVKRYEPRDHPQDLDHT